MKKIIYVAYDIGLLPNNHHNDRIYTYIDGVTISEGWYPWFTIRDILDELYGKEIIINKIKEKINSSKIKNVRVVYIELPYPSEEELLYYSLINKDFIDIINFYKLNGN